MAVATRVAVGIINYQDYRHLPACLDSVKQQTLRPDRVLLLDNQSCPEEIGPVARAHPEVDLLAIDANLGYSGGANRIIREVDGCAYILLLNPDVVLNAQFLRELVHAMESNPRAGSAGGKLLLGDPQASQSPGADHPFLDSTGHVIFRNRRVIDRAHGEADRGQYDQLEHVFSVCGAAVLLRRAMLEEVKIGEEYFDEDFFAYKEDVDICWRAQLLGWASLYVPKATAYHLRGWKRQDDRRNVPWVRKYHSFKNHYLMMVKNELPSIFWRDFFPIIWLGLRAMTYITLMEPSLWRPVFDLGKFWAAAQDKRRVIMRRRRVTAKEMGRWFV